MARGPKPARNGDKPACTRTKAMVPPQIGPDQTSFEMGKIELFVDLFERRYFFGRRSRRNRRQPRMQAGNHPSTVQNPPANVNSLDIPLLINISSTAGALDNLQISL